MLRFAAHLRRRIVTDLHGNDLYTWVVTVYLLTATISGPIYGKLSDLFGRRPILLFAVAVFLLGSLLSGLSQEMWQFVAFRGVQGLGAGALFPVALAVIKRSTPDDAELTVAGMAMKIERVVDA